jgi:hypothetical protein
VRFKVSAEPIAVAVCHCTDCQKASGGPPNYVALAPKTGFEVTKGEARTYVSKGDSGAEIGRAFCSDCGTPLWAVLADMPFVPVKLGALDHNADLAPSMHIYAASAPPWHLMDDGTPVFPKFPPAPPPT